MSPLNYAIGSIFTTPLAVLLIVLLAFVLLLMWPLIPFLCYFRVKAEQQQLMEQWDQHEPSVKQNAA